MQALPDVGKVGKSKAQKIRETTVARSAVVVYGFIGAIWGADNNRAASTATASSFLNTAGKVVHADLEADHADWTASALAATAASPAQVTSAAADGARAWRQFLDERQTAA